MDLVAQLMFIEYFLGSPPNILCPILQLHRHILLIKKGMFKVYRESRVRCLLCNHSMCGLPTVSSEVSYSEQIWFCTFFVDRISISCFPQTPLNRTEHLGHSGDLVIELNGIKAREEHLLLLVQNEM